MASTPLRTRVLVPFVLLGALVAAACGTNSPDPDTRLRAAVDDTMDGSFSYTVGLDADREALDALSAGAGDAATLLETFGFSGVVDGQDAASFAVHLGGSDPLLELRTFSDDAFYVNLGLNDLLSLAGAGAFDPRDELTPALDALGFDEEVKAAVLDALDGRWVGVEGELDVARLQSLLNGEQETVDDEQASEAAEELFGEDLPAFFDRYVTVVETTEDDGTERFDVQLELRELLRAAGELSQRAGSDTVPLEDLEADLQDLPATVPGTVIVEDDHVTELRFDLASAAREAGAEVAGSILVTVRFADFDEIEPLTRPEGATVLDDEQFTDAIAKLVGLTGGL